MSIEVDTGVLLPRGRSPHVTLAALIKKLPHESNRRQSAGNYHPHGDAGRKPHGRTTPVFSSDLNVRPAGDTLRVAHRKISSSLT